MDLKNQYPGIQSIGYLKHINGSELSPYRREYREKFDRDLDIRPEGRSKEHTSLQFFESISGALFPRSPYGLDFFAIPERREAMSKSRDTGQPIASDKVRSLTTTEPGYTFQLYVPHYKPNMKLETIRQRRQALLGFVYAGINVSTLFSDLTEQIKPKSSIFNIEVYDGAEADPGHLMLAILNHQEPDPSLKASVPIQAAENQWTIGLSAPSYFQLPLSRFLPWLVFMVGLAFSVLVTLFFRKSQENNQLLKSNLLKREATEALLREEKQIVELTAKVGTNLKAEQDLDKIVQMVIDTATTLTGAEMGVFLYRTKDNGRYYLSHAISGKSQLPPQFLSILPENFFDQRFTAPAPIYRSLDVLSDQMLIETHEGGACHDVCLSEQIQKLPATRSFLATPIVSKSGETLGGLVFVHSDPRVFAERSENILRAIAVQAAVAMDNAHLFRELRHAQTEAQSSNQAKSMFLANISHEIRTPLGVIIGGAELALEDIGKPAELKRHLGMIIRNGKELTRILGDVLDLTKIEANHLEIEQSHFSLHLLLDQVGEIWSLRAREKGITLNIVRAPGLPEFIYSDPTRLRQILVNLIGNAVKFTEKGSVQLLAEASKRDSQGRVQLDFKVADTGHGISSEHQSRLFTAFSQADSSITRRFGGTGLGLMISRELARAMNGELILKSTQVDQGSIFRLTIPVTLGDAMRAQQVLPTIKPSLQTLSGVHILVVEDSVDNQLLATRYLESVGAKVDIAEDGKEGYQKALDGNFDVVLMDLQMPRLDGYGSVAHLRNQGYRKPIIALTARALKEEKERALNRGFDDYITKPLDRHLLVSTIAKLKAHQFTTDLIN